MLRRPLAWLAILSAAFLPTLTATAQPSAFAYDRGQHEYDRDATADPSAERPLPRQSYSYDEPSNVAQARSRLSGNTLAAEEAANEGIYVIRGARGTYVGQSGNISARFSQHLIQNGGRFTQAELDAAERIGVTGGRTAREIAEQQKIDELGGIDVLLNIRNPIGPRRFGLMPQPYSRP